MWTSENNWYKWEHAPDFKTSFACKYTPIKKTFKQAAIDANASILEYHKQQPTLLFSGGVDSEIILRSFLSANIKPKVFIFRYENDYNLYDVSYAITICNSLGVDYNLIDFNLGKFFETEAERLSEFACIDRPRALPYCKFIELVDELPILGSSDLSLVRINDDYSEPGQWMVRCWEHDVAWSRFVQKLNKPAVGEWFKWTPDLVYTYTQTLWCKSLVSDKFFGKLGTNSTKIQGYRESYPDLLERKKQTGFEKVDSIINEFEIFLNKKYNGLPYRRYFDRPITQLLNEMKR